MGLLYKTFSGKRVFVTGHTGFKGSWLCEWLLALDSEVWGYSLPPDTKPALFNQLGLSARVHHVLGDTRDAESLETALIAAKPDYVFHLAAQPIVRAAHSRPADTWSTNVMGTVNLLEALRTLKKPCAAVVVTTDKVYGTSARPHAETDSLGAHEPYGGSKAAVELAVDAWRQAFFRISRTRRKPFPKVALATARAGNVIGGGDWARDRLLPDCARALARGNPLLVRNPSAIRPWQHVLDPLSGYLTLAAELRRALVSGRPARLAELSGPFNFGPSARDHRSVRAMVAEVFKHWPGTWRRAAAPAGPIETEVLRLDARKARAVLGWSPTWGFRQSVHRTAAWYQGASSSKKAAELTRRQLEDYSLS